MKKQILLLVFLVAFGSVNSQQIQNVQATQDGKNIIVSYDLSGASSGDAFEVELYCSTDGGATFGNALKSVSGDAGKEIKPGTMHRISWDVLADREKLSGNRIVFEVRARTTDQAGIEMMFVKGGTFTMGCTSEQSDCDGNEKPTHQVTLSDFYIGKYEVTVAQFKNFIDETSYSTDADKDGGSYFWTGSGWTKKSGVNWKSDATGTTRPQSEYNHPVIHVSWNDAIEYCKWLNRKTGKNYRLPTEAEWEYAARDGVQTNGHSSLYAGSNNIDEVAWYDGNSGSKTHPVGKKKPNELGLYDMTGNVWEWCSDWYGSDYYKNSSRNNPQGPSSGSYRVLRGGSWYGNARRCRVANRYNHHPDIRNINYGFRLVLAP
ncbi:MAG: formylglycine-generating enzyme family protein [Bacteroidales bacterium]|nr:formylglycine-generating enzyme family protein [Bacteroidales bacterium]